MIIIPLPIGTIICPEGMPAQTIFRFGKSKDEYLVEVNKAIEEYQKKEAIACSSSQMQMK